MNTVEKSAGPDMTITVRIWDHSGNKFDNFADCHDEQTAKEILDGIVPLLKPGTRITFGTSSQTTYIVTEQPE